MGVAKPDRRIMEAILTKKKTVSFEFLALQIFLSRAIRSVEENPESLGMRVKQFDEFLDKYMVFPELRKDLEKLA